MAKDKTIARTDFDRCQDMVRFIDGAEDAILSLRKDRKIRSEVASYCLSKITELRKAINEFILPDDAPVV